VRKESVEENHIPYIEVFHLAMKFLSLFEVLFHGQIIALVIMTQVLLEVGILIGLVLAVRQSHPDEVIKCPFPVAVEYLRRIVAETLTACSI
jgi:hypothetical protein